MTTTVRSDYEEALAVRLRTVGSVLLDGPLPEPDEDPARDAADMLERLVVTVRADPTQDRVWLLCVGISGAFPTPEETLEAGRILKLFPVDDAMFLLLDRVLSSDVVAAATPLELVTGAVVVDVDHTARNDLHTGVQRVVRQMLPRWQKEHEVIPVVWTDGHECTRRLTKREVKLACEWEDGLAVSSGEVEAEAEASAEGEVPAADAPGAEMEGPPALVVPWRSVVVLTEVPAQPACDRLASVAEHSGNAVVALCHDCIPVLSADLVPEWEPGRFARYLRVVKHCRRVAGISQSSASEVRGFVEALPVQGLAGPEVFACLEATEAVPSPSGASETSPRRDPGLPLVLSVGSLEPRKNQLAVVYAAERLWREGLAFELLLVGGSGWGDELPDQVARLQAAGRVVSIAKKVSDTVLANLYEEARFTVFPSLHEGYGLPVAESLGAGTPVITSDFGSTAEIGRGGGALLVDPRDDEAIVAAMRTLLTDDDALSRLRQAAQTRPVRTWDQFASELWDGLVLPEAAELGLSW